MEAEVGRWRCGDVVLLSLGICAQAAVEFSVTAPTTTTATAAAVLSPAGQGQSAVSSVRHRLGFPASKYQDIYTIRQPDI